MTNEEIDKMISQLEELKTEKPSQIIIPDCDWMIDVKGVVSRSYSQDYNLEYGYKRTTEEACKLASKRMIRTNRLSLLAHILDVEKEFEKEHNNNCYLYQNLDNKKWKISCSEYTYHPERVYMTKEGVESVADILNNGEFSLELDENTN